MPYKVFVAGEEALAADVNSYLMSQTVPRFTNAAQRTAQLTAPVLNQLSMRDDAFGLVEYWSGSAWRPVPGSELHYSEITANVTSTVTAAASATVVIPGASVVYDGGPIVVNFQAPNVNNSGSAAVTYVSLWMDGSDLGVLGSTGLIPSGSPAIAMNLSRRVAPAAGAHTFSIRLWVSGGTATVTAGVGGSGTYIPAFLRITKT